MASIGSYRSKVESMLRAEENKLVTSVRLSA
jgi:hypothetical protein